MIGGHFTPTPETMFLFYSFLTGIMLTFVYDGFLVLRKLFRHSVFGISVEDFLFWIFCAGLVFWELYKENNGMLRWFAVGGAATGMMLYKKLLSKLVIHAEYAVLNFLCRQIAKIWTILSAPWKRAGNRCKKRLTEQVKMLKIVINKR